MRKVYLACITFIGLTTLALAYVVPEDDFDGQVIKHFAYTLKYCKKWHQAYWVAYEINAEKLRAPACKRNDRFRPDPAVEGGSAKLSDYSRSGYDRGHMAPAAVFKWSPKAMLESFYLSNMSPQTKDCNRKIWKMVEARVRDIAMEYGVVNVITGPIVIGKVYQEIGSSRVAVPQLYFKVVLDRNMKPIECFVVPNRGSKYPPSYFNVPIKFVTALTDLRFPAT
ncbi:DNA/RNA non-specific endonuclease [Lentisphaerota bacterium ZTH]|nr:DNA/RNA non-specific endonuclease [Lentisphaerota bacterium]WET05165.1 DNA/RNA non-specific endonuclease [Lentisphaerota bacterium ZTH]